MRTLSPPSCAVALGLGLAVALTGCATPEATGPLLQRVEEAPAPGVDPIDRFPQQLRTLPADEMSESDRIEWHRRRAPPRVPRHSQTLAAPVRVVEREVVRAGSADRYERWWPPIAISLGYWWGRHHRHHRHHHSSHWGWGVGWRVPLW